MRTPLLGAATIAVLAAGALATTSVIGSSHREAPRIMLDPSADNTDVYAFVAPDAPGKLTVVSNWVPLQSPAGGPYFGKLDPAARYYVKIDNTGDGVEDVAYRWQFKNRFRNPNSFLYAVPPVNSISDPNLNFIQTYDLYYETYDRRRPSRRLPADRATTCRSRPTTSGRRRCRTTRRSPTARSAAPRGGGKTFVGPADDPFFVDLGAVFDGINIDKPGRPTIGLGNQGGGKDDVSGYNAHSFVLQVPTSEVDPRRPSGQQREGPQRRRRRVVDHRAPFDQGQRQRQRQGRLGAGQPPRQPADQRGDHPDRPQGQVQRARARRPTARTSAPPRPARSRPRS